jgi:hypothetical protein
MKRQNTAAYLVVVLILAGCAGQKQAGVPLSLPEGVIYESQDDVEFQSFRWGEDEAMALFMMSPHPAGLSQDMVDVMANSKAVSGLETELLTIEGVNTLDREDRALASGRFSGKEIVFTLEMSDGKTVYQAMYILWDGTRLWQGQLTGAQPRDFDMVRAILESFKSVW